MTRVEIGPNEKYGDITAINGAAPRKPETSSPAGTGKTMVAAPQRKKFCASTPGDTVPGFFFRKTSRRAARSGIVTDTAVCDGSMSALENL